MRTVAPAAAAAYVPTRVLSSYHAPVPRSPAAAILAAALLSGCPRNPGGGSEDAGPPPEPGLSDGGADYAFCPASIDVFGGQDAVLQGCGGLPSALSDQGQFEPGDAGYDASLAGRLRARLLADPLVTARFGTLPWKVRSCARPGTMGSFVRVVPPAECGNGGNTGDDAILCTADPAPLVLFSATNVLDRCHGGGLDSTYDDDEAGYADHWRARFEEFRAERDAGFILVSPEADWHGQGLPGANCGWSRIAWNSSGSAHWRALNPSADSVRRIGELHSTFERHHPCCAERDAGCEESWFPEDAGAGLDGWTTFDCRGADAVVELWYQELRGFLLNNRFRCP